MEKSKKLDLGFGLLGARNININIKKYAWQGVVGE